MTTPTMTMTKDEAQAALVKAVQAKAELLTGHSKLRDELNAKISKEVAAATKTINQLTRKIGKIEYAAAIQTAMKQAQAKAGQTDKTETPESQASPPAPGDNTEA